MKKCSCCGSYAVNPGRSGRDESSDLDLCDVCYWRKRADNTGEGQEITFGEALRFLKLGKRVARAGWNGANQFVYLVPKNSCPVQTEAVKAYFADVSQVTLRAHLMLKTAQGDIATWAPSCSDVLAEDWLVVDYAQPAGVR